MLIFLPVKYRIQFQISQQFQSDLLVYFRQQKSLLIFLARGTIGVSWKSVNNFQRFSKPLFRAQSAVHRVSFLRALCFRCSPRVLEKRVSTPLQPFIMRLFHADFPAFRGRGPVEYSRLFLIYIFDPLFFHVSLPPPSVLGLQE